MPITCGEGQCLEQYCIIAYLYETTDNDCLSYCFYAAAFERKKYFPRSVCKLQGACYFTSGNIPETVYDKDVVTMEDSVAVIRLELGMLWHLPCSAGHKFSEEPRY